MRNEIGILMAAGQGLRMRPLTEKIPKPLIQVKGIPLIETVINGLQKRQVRAIYVVVGYMKEQFSYLCRKYENLQIVENTEYLEKNNISSLYAAGDILGSTDCFICEADLYVADDSVFHKAGDSLASCYLGKKVDGYSDDWVFQTKGGRITKITKGGENLYNMAGISYWKKADARRIKDAIRNAYRLTGHEKLFWDEVVNSELGNMNVILKEVHPCSIVEVDTMCELKELEDSLK